MKFSEAWLREWVNPSIDREKLTNHLTMAGLEVDAIEPVAGAFSGVVVGRVIECKPHPDADKLRVTKVDVGEAEPLNIVCGAANCREGLVVACARIGANLPGNVKIKAAKLRGVPSEGMLCSYSELAIDDDHSGIIELPQDAVIGADIRDYMQLDDMIIDISITPNRADCFSIRGVARDLSAVCNTPLSEPSIEKVTATITDSIPIRVIAAESCPRYLGRIIKGININSETPLWMKEKLRRAGIRSIDPLVDVTNYVMLELGQPMHAFDLAKIDSEIVVRMAKPGEELTLLNGNLISLQDDVVVVSDKNRPLALAGIFGGKDSGVTQSTQDVLLESAYFAPLSIVNRARRFGLHTESSHRFERGVDPTLSYQAMERATALILAICGGQAGPVIEQTTEAYLPKIKPITLKRDRLDSLIGKFIEDDAVKSILERLGCQVTVQKQQWQVVVPKWRFDLNIEADLIEEVARIYGYDNIPNIPVIASLAMTQHHEEELSINRVKSRLIDRGYQEVVTYSFVDPKIQSIIHPELEALRLPNPISADMSVMRLSIWSGLLTAAVYNQNRQQSRIRIFEGGLCFIPSPQTELGIRQEFVLAGLITGSRYGVHWDLPRDPVDFYDLKGDVESILELTGCLDEVEFVASNNLALHPGQSADILLAGQKVGVIGVIHPEIERKLDLDGKTIVFELNWDKLSVRKLPSYTELSKFPSNRRDISVVVKETISAADILNECKNVGGDQLVGVELFDVYQGKGIGEGCKSLAISLILQDKTRTLGEEEITTTITKCVTALKQRFGASLRD